MKTGRLSIIIGLLIITCGTLCPGSQVSASTLLTDASEDEAEDEIDFFNTEDNDDIPEEFSDKVLTRELQNALSESLKKDDYDPEAALDGAENINPATDPTDGEPLYLDIEGTQIDDTDTEVDFEDFMSSIMIDDHPDLEISYDDERERYVYSFPDERSFAMTAPLGGISNEPVKVSLLGDIGFLNILKNGEELFGSPQEMSEFTAAEEGSYLFTILDSRGGVDGSESYEIRGGFRIVNAGSATKISMVSTPAGMKLSGLTRNGKKAGHDRTEFALLDEDGEYDIFYTLGNKEKANWKVRLVRDTTAPLLLFSEPIDEKVIYRPVSFQTIRKDTQVRVFWNNSEIMPNGNMIGEDGNYRIEASDALGNTRIYRFTIARGMGFDFKRLAILAGILIAAGLTVVLTARRSMRII